MIHCMILSVLPNCIVCCNSHVKLINGLNESYDNFKDIDLVEIGQALISVLDMQRLFPLLNNLTLSGTDSLSGIIVLVNGDEVQVKASYGLSQQVANNVVFKIGDGAIGSVVKQGTPVIINNVEHDPRFSKQQFKWYHGKTLLCVPIKTQNRVAGVISVSGKKGATCIPTTTSCFWKHLPSTLLLP